MDFLTFLLRNNIAEFLAAMSFLIAAGVLLAEAVRNRSFGLFAGGALMLATTFLVALVS